MLCMKYSLSEQKSPFYVLQFMAEEKLAMLLPAEKSSFRGERTGDSMDEV